MTILAADLSRSAVLMDPGQAREVFQRHLPGFAAGGLRIDGCTILHSRYRTSPEDALQGKAFLSVCYRLDVRDPARAEADQQVLHLKAYPPGKSARRFDRASREQAFRPRFGEAIAHLRDLDAVVWAFPNDPKLPHLREVVDAQLVRGHLPYPRLPAGADSPASIRDVRVEVIRYKPEVRCTTRYELRGPGLEADGVVVYGKTFAHGRAAEISRRMQILWTQSSGSGRALRVARPLGHSEAVKTVWQEGLPGIPLVQLSDTRDSSDIMEGAGAGLARFHRARMESLPSTTPHADLESARAEAAEMAKAFPRRAGQLDAAVCELERGVESLEEHAPGLVHGDFLLKQLVLHEGRLGLCDFDNLSIGDPLRDLANFIVDLNFQPFGESLLDDMAARFLGAYAAERGRAVPANRLRWQYRVHVLRSAYYFYKRRHWMPGFDDELARILELAHRRGPDA